MKDYYYLLGVSRQAQPEDIKKAYRRLASKFHPDANQGDVWFAERFKEIQEAYDILSDQMTKLDYDRQLTSIFGSVYQRNMPNEEEAHRREEQIRFKEEVLKRKQAELESREAEMRRQLQDLQEWYSKWYNRFNFTRKLYEKWMGFEAFLQQVQNSLPGEFNLPRISSTAIIRRVRQVKQFVILKKGLVLAGICVFSLALFGFFHYTNPSPNTEETIALETLAFNSSIYEGSIDDFEAVFALEWGEDDSLRGSYFYANDEQKIFTLRGLNSKEGELRLKGYLANKLVTQLKLQKLMSDSTICWEGKMLNRGGIMMNVNMCRERDAQILSNE